MLGQDRERCPGSVCVSIEGKHEREMGEEIEAAAVFNHLSLKDKRVMVDLWTT